MYSQDGNRNFVFMTTSGPLNCGPVVAILFEPDTGIIAAHGVPAVVRAKRDILTASFADTGIDQELVYLEGGHFTAEFLNDMLAHTGKIKYWWREHAEILGFFCAPTIH